MNTIIFFAGMGAGALITTLLFLLLINRLVGQRSKDTERIYEYNEASLSELKRRNDIGKQQVSSLATIAAWCEHNRKSP